MKPLKLKFVIFFVGLYNKTGFDLVKITIVFALSIYKGMGEGVFEVSMKNFVSLHSIAGCELFLFTTELF